MKSIWDHDRGVAFSLNKSDAKVLERWTVKYPAHQDSHLYRVWYESNYCHWMHSKLFEDRNRMSGGIGNPRRLYRWRQNNVAKAMLPQATWQLQQLEAQRSRACSNALFTWLSSHSRRNSDRQWLKLASRGSRVWIYILGFPQARGCDSDLNLIGGSVSGACQSQEDIRGRCR